MKICNLKEKESVLTHTNQIFLFKLCFKLPESFLALYAAGFNKAFTKLL